MPSIDTRTLRMLTSAQRRYNDSLARQQAAIRLDEVETYLQHERQKRGLEPVTCDNGKVIAWVRTRPQQPTGDR